MLLDEEVQPLDVEQIPQYLSKKPYMAPKLIPIFELDIASSVGSGPGDGDAQFAIS